MSPITPLESSAWRSSRLIRPKASSIRAMLAVACPPSTRSVSSGTTSHAVRAYALLPRQSRNRRAGSSRRTCDRSADTSPVALAIAACSRAITSSDSAAALSTTSTSSSRSRPAAYDLSACAASCGGCFLLLGMANILPVASQVQRAAPRTHRSYRQPA